MNAAYGAPAAAGPAKFTRLSKVIGSLLGALAVLTTIYPASRAYLALVPGRTLPCVWNLVTATFISSNPVKAIAEIVALLLLARVIEPIYGSTEFLRMLLVTSTASSTAIFVGVYILYLTSPSKDGDMLYTQFCGFHGVIGGLLVAVKQIMADQEIKLLGVAKLRARWLPSLYVIAAGALVVAFKAWTLTAYLLLCPYIAWVYLRFFQWQPETTIRGDASEEFKFSSFFPDALQAPIDVVARICSLIFCLRHSPDAVAASSGGLGAAGLAGAGGEGRPLLAHGANPSVGADSKDANRRRERGAKALEERLMAGKAAAAGGSAPAAAPDPVDSMEAGTGPGGAA